MEWRAVAFGVAVAVVVAFVAGILAAVTVPDAGIFAPLFGVAIGAYLAAIRVNRAPLYHGALVAAGYVLLEGVGIVPTPFAAADNALADSLAVILSDVLLLLMGALAGAIAGRGAPSSSSGTGTGR